MQWIIFYQKQYERKSDNGSTQNIIIKKHNFSYALPNSTICAIPFLFPHPESSSERILITPLLSKNKTKCYAILGIVVSSLENALEVEKTKSKFILEAYNGVTSVKQERCSVAEQFEPVKFLSRVESCIKYLSYGYKDKDYFSFYQHITVPLALESMNKAIAKIRHDFDMKRDETDEIEELSIDQKGFQNSKAAEAVIVTKKFIHQANKALLGLDINELTYLIEESIVDESMFDSIDEVVFLAEKCASRLRRMFLNYYNYDKERIIRVSTVDIQSELIPMLSAYSRTLDLKEQSIELMVNHGVLRNKKVQTDLDILIEAIETVLSNAIDELKDEHSRNINPRMRISITLKEEQLKNSDDSMLKIVIEDNGRGFDLSHGEKFFFGMGNTTKSGNTGLGLGIAKEILERIGASINLSNGYNLGGAKITISIPMTFPHEHAILKNGEDAIKYI